MYDRRYDDALVALERACEIAPDIRGFDMAPVELLRTTAMARLGQTEKARTYAQPIIEKTLERMKTASRGWGFPWRLAVVHGAIGADEDALRWLETAADAGFVYPVLAERHPAFDGVRETPRYVAVMSRIEARLEEERREAGL